MYKAITCKIFTEIKISIKDISAVEITIHLFVVLDIVIVGRLSIMIISPSPSQS